MKGLLIKDLRLTLQNKRLIAVILLLAVMLTTLKGEDAVSFIVSFATMICGTMVLNTISLDEFDKSVVFLMTMPIERGIYVIEKYIFALGSGLFGCVLSSTFCILFVRFPAFVILQQASMIFLVLSFFLLIILPVQLKFGSDMGRIVLFGIVIFFVLLANLIAKVGEENFFGQLKEKGNQLFQWILSCDQWVLCLIALVLWGGCLFLSIAISKNIIKKKEY